jgi:uroporphyrinogen-III synthase
MSDLSDLADVYYDILAFFSPTGIKSLFMNFPDFEQNNTHSGFGSTTQKKL